MALPSNYPNIFQILWSNLSLGDVEFKVMEEKLTISGDIHLFVLYEGEGEEKREKDQFICLKLFLQCWDRAKASCLTIMTCLTGY